MFTNESWALYFRESCVRDCDASWHVCRFYLSRAVFRSIHRFLRIFQILRKSYLTTHNTYITDPLQSHNGLLIDIRTKLKTYVRRFHGWSRLANISFPYSIQVIPIVFMRVSYSIFRDRYSIFPIIIKQNVFCFQRLSIPLWPWPLYPAHFFIISQPLSSQRVAFVFLLVRLSRFYHPKTTTSLANLISNCRKSIFSLIPLSNWTRRAGSAGR